jgi:hypothetical protein
MANNIKTLMFAVTLLLLIGCQSTPSHLDHRPALVQKLEKLGVTEISVDKMVLVGSEGGWGSRTQVTINASYLTREIWDTIHQSRPHKAFTASGNRKLRFYEHQDSKEPLAELLVNGTDLCYFEDNFYDSYRCPGINKILRPLLKREYDKNNSTEKPDRSK